MTDLARLRRLVATNDPASDADLLDRFITDRDGSAFAVLVRRHGPMVLSVCRRVLRHRQDAEDAFQATFLVLARRAGAVKPRSLLGNWLYGVAYRTALGARRAASRRRIRETHVAAGRTEAVVPDDSNLSPELLEALDRELAVLPDVYRAALVACDLEGLSRREAADRLEWTEGTLSSRLARARSLLARRLSRYGLAVPVAGLVAVTGLPAVASELTDSTIRLGILVAFGDAVVAPPVAALMEVAMRTMFLSKLKALAAVLVVVCAVSVGTLTGWRANAVGAADPPKVAEPPKQMATNSDKERIAELERDRDRLLKEVAELRDRLTKAEAERRATAVEQKVAHLLMAEREAVLRGLDASRTPPGSKPAPDALPMMQAGPRPPGPTPPGVVREPSSLRLHSVEALAKNEKEGEALVKVVKAVVEPKSWGTTAGIEYLLGQKLLVVRQTQTAHDQVEELLNALVYKKAQADSGVVPGPFRK